MKNNGRNKTLEEEEKGNPKLPNETYLWVIFLHIYSTLLKFKLDNFNILLYIILAFVSFCFQFYNKSPDFNFIVNELKQQKITVYNINMPQ